jgi:hypothetical protein
MQRAVILALLLLASTAHAGTENSRADVREHFGAGAAVAALTTYYMLKGMHPGWRWAAGVAAGMVAGALKEGVYDKHPDKTDWSQWAGGAVLGATLVTFTF